MSNEIAALHNPFKAWLKQNGYAWFRSRSDKRTSTNKGDPDFIVARGNRVALVEFKALGNRLSIDQVTRHGELAWAGCKVCTAYDLETAIAHVEAEINLQAPVSAKSPRRKMDSEMRAAVSGSDETREGTSKTPDSSGRDSRGLQNFRVGNWANGEHVFAQNHLGEWMAIRTATPQDRANLARL